MREIRIHLKDQISARCERVTKPGDVGITKTCLRSPVQDGYPARVVMSKSISDPASSIGGCIVNNVDPDLRNESQKRRDHWLDILCLVIGRKDYANIPRVDVGPRSSRFRRIGLRRVYRHFEF